MITKVNSLVTNILGIYITVSYTWNTCGKIHRPLCIPPHFEIFSPLDLLVLFVRLDHSVYQPAPWICVAHILFGPHFLYVVQFFLCWDQSVLSNFFSLLVLIWVLPISSMFQAQYSPFFQDSLYSDNELSGPSILVLFA